VLGRPKGHYSASAAPLLNCTISFRQLLSGLLDRLAGSGLASGRYIVDVAPHETGCVQHSVLGMPRAAGSSAPRGAGWVLWMVGRWLHLPLSNGRSPRTMDTAMVEVVR